VNGARRVALRRPRPRVGRKPVRLRADHASVPKRKRSHCQVAHGGS
jgi:hypothetical protein